MYPTYKYCAVGTLSLNVYIISNTKAQCMSLLQKNYKRIKEHTLNIDHSARPNRSRYFFGQKQSVHQSLLPETMFFVKVPGSWSDDDIHKYFMTYNQRRIENEKTNARI